jgi:Arc/MetJ family transcription regulator
MPRMTIEIDPALLEEARKVLGVRTKHEAIEQALWQLVRQQRVRDMRKHAGQVDLDLSQEDLQQLREDRP